MLRPHPSQAPWATDLDALAPGRRDLYTRASVSRVTSSRRRVTLPEQIGQFSGSVFHRLGEWFCGLHLLLPQDHGRVSWRSRCYRMNLILLEPANGFEPLTCAFRGISHNPRSLQSLKILVISRPLRRRESTKTPDGGECAPRVPQKHGAVMDSISCAAPNRRRKLAC